MIESKTCWALKKPVKKLFFAGFLMKHMMLVSSPFTAGLELAHTFNLQNLQWIFAVHC